LSPSSASTFSRSSSTPILKKNPFNPQKNSLVDFRFFTRSFSKPSMLKSKLDVPLRNDSLNFTILLRKSSCVLSLSVSLYVSSLSKTSNSQNKKNVDTQHIRWMFMCPRCLSLYQLPLKRFWKWPQFAETILTYLIPVVRFELAASMQICSPPSSSSSPSSSERWKSDQIIILTKKKLSISAATSGSNL
jgi:hypothetical protein